jgi:hypothetical protein
MKNHAAPARPMHTIQKSVDVQIQQATIACATNEAATQLMIDKQIFWSDLPTKAHLNNRGESLVAVQWNLSSNYYVVRCDKMQWKVTIMAAKTPEGPIPVFRRVRVVELGEDGRLHCSCCLFERHGYGCRHMLTVLKSEVPDYRGFQVEDVSIHWWTIYYHFGERPKLNLNLATMLRRLHKQDIEGPILPTFQLIIDRWNPSSIGGSGIHHRFLEKECRRTVANYSPEDVRAATNRFSVDSTIGLNLSQISVNYPSDTDDGSYDLVSGGNIDLNDSDDVNFDVNDGEVNGSESVVNESEVNESEVNGSEVNESVTIDEATTITFPAAVEVAQSYKDTNAFQAVGPLMKEYLGLLELADQKESKIKSLVDVMSQLINSEKRDQQKDWVNNNK